MKKLIQLAISAFMLWMAWSFWSAPPPGGDAADMDYRVRTALLVGRTLGNWELTARQLEVIIALVTIYCLALGHVAEFALSGKGFGVGVNCLIALAVICACAWLRKETKE